LTARALLYTYICLLFAAGAAGAAVTAAGTAVFAVLVVVNSAPHNGSKNG